MKITDILNFTKNEGKIFYREFSIISFLKYGLFGTPFLFIASIMFVSGETYYILAGFIPLFISIGLLFKGMTYFFPRYLIINFFLNKKKTKNTLPKFKGL